MTYKYLSIRREVFENDIAKELNKKRSWKQILQIVKIPYWLLFMSSMSSLFIGIFLIRDNLGQTVVLLVGNVLGFIGLNLKEKLMYDDAKRQEEIKQKEIEYSSYIIKATKVLFTYGIDTKSKFLKLKNECESSIKQHEDKYTILGNKLLDTVLWLPLGTFATSMNALNPEFNLLYIFTIGAIIYIFSKIHKLASFYSDGYVKDKYLLDALNELEYQNAIYSK